MKKINIIFEYDYSDVDILSVSNYVADNLDEIVQRFFDWMSDEKNNHNYRIQNSNGTSTLEIGTEAFVWWLNTQCIGDTNAKIMAQHVNYCPDYPIADF